MAGSANKDIVAHLRERIRRIEGIGEAGGHGLLPLGLEPVDRMLPGGGLALGGVHEIQGAEDGAATGFCAAMLARLQETDGRPVLWLERGRDLYMPGLVRFGLKAGTVLTVSDIVRDADMLWAAEEALQSGAVAAVVAEIRLADFTASRRLQLAAEAGGVTCLLLSDRQHGGAATALSRWQVRAEPSFGDGTGVGSPCWRVELARCRNGRAAAWTVIWEAAGGVAVDVASEEPMEETHLPESMRAIG
jgi:protein ImuA